MKHVDIYTDGACRGNPGPGGWGAILVYGTVEKEICGGEASTTNNRMELLGAISALRLLKEPCDVTLTSDSKYLVDAIREGWLASWESHGWKKPDKKPVQNVDLWKKLLVIMKPHDIRFEWVHGHQGHPYNERCDKLATAYADAIAATAPPEGKTITVSDI